MFSWLGRDVRLIRTLQGRYGLSTQSDVLRFALRTVGEARRRPFSGRPHVHTDAPQ
jgi:hypothetical protein